MPLYVQDLLFGCLWCKFPIYHHPLRFLLFLILINRQCDIKIVHKTLYNLKDAAICTHIIKRGDYEPKSSCSTFDACQT